MNSPAIVTGKQNKKIVEIRKLRARKNRELSGLFFVEGIRVVGVATEAGAQIETLVVAPELLTSDYGRDLVERERAVGTRVLEVSADVFRSLSTKDGPQGLGAVVRRRMEALGEATAPAGEGGLWIALDAAQDPGNLGTILRTADATGGAGVILTGRAADPFDPTCVRASMGSIFTVKVFTADFSALVAWARAGGARLIATSGAATTSFRETSYVGPVVLVMGSEREGLSRDQLKACDEAVSIPMVGRCDSLNLAVAAGVVLYEAMRQRQKV